MLIRLLTERASLSRDQKLLNLLPLCQLLDDEQTVRLFLAKKAVTFATSGAAASAEALFQILEHSLNSHEVPGANSSVSVSGEPQIASPDFLRAIDSGDVSTVTAFLDRGCSVESRDADGKTLLMLSAERGYSRLAQLLISRKADIFATDSKRRVALHFASSVAVARALVECNGGYTANGGALALHWRSSDKHTPFLEATETGRLRVAHYLQSVTYSSMVAERSCSIHTHVRNSLSGLNWSW